MLNTTDSATNTGDNVGSAERVESVDPKLFEELHSAIYPNQVDGAQANQQLVYTGHIPALEIVSSESAALNDSGRAIEEDVRSVQEREALNTMIFTDGQKVFGAPKLNSPDYFDLIDGLDDRGTFWNGKDGAITKEGLALFIRQNDSANQAPLLGYNDPNKKDYVESAKHLFENWDRPELAAYKDANGAMTKESYVLGLAELPAIREQLAASKIELHGRTVEWLDAVNSQAVQEDTSSAETAETSIIPTSKGTAEVQPPASVLSEDAAQLSLVRRGEGPYNVAERILSVDGAASPDEIWALTRAMQAQYGEENPQDPHLASLKVNHQFLTEDKAAQLMELIPDEAMRATISAKLFTQVEAPQDQPVPDGVEPVPADSATAETENPAVPPVSESAESVSEATVEPAAAPNPVPNPETESVTVTAASSESGSQPVGESGEANRYNNPQLLSVLDREAFNRMISNDGMQVFSQSNQKASELFDLIDGQDDPGTFWNGKDGAITKGGLQRFLETTSAVTHRGGIDPVRAAFYSSAKEIYANFDSPEMDAYKDSLGAITRDSFARGMQSLPERLDQVALDRAALSS